ncbi:MAG: alanine racemase [Magnetococcales bacterium]|nr:alanine racemase [Magnetococcales bacterium]
MNINPPNPSEPPQGRPTWVDVDLDAVRHNFHLAKQAMKATRLPGQQIAIYPVVKADGYGLGATPIAKALHQSGADGFCVATVEEAVTLREAGIRAPIVLLAGFSRPQAPTIVKLELEPLLFRADEARYLAESANPKQPIAVHIQFDTGMARLGSSMDEALKMVHIIHQTAGLKLVGISSHLACADQPTRPENLKQVQKLRAILSHEGFANRTLRVSLANSGGLLGVPESHFDWGRPGIMLYGGSPFFPEMGWREAGLHAVARWHSRIIQIQTLDTGTPMGYGHTETTTRPSRIGQLPVGYADGLNRLHSNRKGWVAIEGVRAPIVGRVCMDLTAVDVTDIPAAHIGSEAILLGGDEAGIEPDVEEMATWTGTIPYEVLCRLGQRVPRRYLHQK